MTIRAALAVLLCGPALAVALLAGGRTPARPPVENFREVGSELCVGGEPVGEAAFQALADRGVRTVVSVDGARPDLAAARKSGLRYVHIPFGYDGIPRKAALSLARVVRDCDGPIYVHCHHGKHRGPAAAAVMGVASGRLDSEQAARLLERAGTSRDYAGLWRDVAIYAPPPPDADLPELVETAEVEPLAVAMADIDRLYERLKAAEAVGWRGPADQSDVVPPREAALLREMFRESARLLPADRAALRPGLKDAQRLSARLADALKSGEHAVAAAKLAEIETGCSVCHRLYRDGE